MFLSMLRLAPKKWTEIPKDSGHRMPADPREYHNVKKALVGENVLQGHQVFDITRQGDGATVGGKGNFRVEYIFS